LLQDEVGQGRPSHDASLDEVVAQVPSSRLPGHELVNMDPLVRLRYSRGQSLPDWIALRSGQIDHFPDGVARPQNGDDVQALLAYAKKAGATVVPYGGGTSVLGHVNVVDADRPVLTVAMENLCQLHQLDHQSRLATFGAGVSGPQLEEQLNQRGYTLGHFPQSFEHSTLGGWIATRSSGQQAMGYGRIERLFAGGTLVAPAGSLELPAFPASAAGPDLREMVLGSEGRLGILTEAVVRIAPLAEFEEFHALFFPEWQRALTAARDIAQAGLPLSLLRLSTGQETVVNLALAGHAWLIKGLERFLAWGGIDDGKCMLMVGATGSRRLAQQALAEAKRIAAGQDGRMVGRTMGRAWHKHRFRAPYARNSLWDQGYAVDTLETAVDWLGVNPLLERLEGALREGLASQNEKVLVFSHLSHLYPSGSNIYTTYAFRQAERPESTLRRWQRLKRVASEAIIASGGTISHQHGVGTDHLPYLEAEKGRLGLRAIRDVCKGFDPRGIMNPGKLIP
jgi:alkyldihydroxyacetonephosphate synthase